MTVVTQREILDSIIPKTTIESITLESSPNLSVTVRYSISDISENDAISQWFKNQEYEKYFTTTSEVVATYAGTGVSGSDSLTERFVATPRTSTVGNMSELDRVLTRDSDNLDVVKFFFEVKFDLNISNERLINLSIVVENGFDLYEMERDLGIDLSFALGVVVNDSRLFRLQTIQVISNRQLIYPVQDFRNRGDTTNPFALTPPEGYLSSFQDTYAEALRKLEEDIQNSSDFISDLWISRSAQCDAKFVFIFDANSFYEKKSEFRRYFQRLSQGEKESIIRELQISSLKIKRKRVKIIQTPTGKHIEWYDNESYPPEIVVETSKGKMQSVFNSASSESGAIKQINIAGIAGNNLHFLTGTDYQVSELTDGIYAYGVSIEIIDSMKNILLSKISEFRKSTKSVREVLNILSLPKNYDSYNKTFVRDLGTIYEEFAESAGMTDNPILRDLNFSAHISGFMELMKIFTGNAAGLGGTFSILYQLQSIGIGSAEQNEKYFTPELLNAVLELSELLIKNALIDIGESQSNDLIKIPLSRSDARIQGERFYLTQDKLFDANIPKFSGLEYLSNFSVDTDDDVLREISSLASDDGEVGLKVIDGATYEARITSEINKFFTSEVLNTTIPILSESPTSSRINLRGPGSEFLTPSAFFDGTSQDDSSSNTSIFRGASDIQNMSGAMGRNVMREMDNINRIPGNIYQLRDAGREEASFFAKLNVGFNSADTKTLLARDIGLLRGTDSSSNSPDRRDTISELREVRSEALEEQKFEKFFFSKFVDILSTPNLGTDRTLVNSRGRARDIEQTLSVDSRIRSAWSEMPVSTRAIEFINAPNVVKAYSLVGDSSVRALAIPREQGSYKVNLNFLTVIEYLSGFESGLVSRPIWSPLTLNEYFVNQNVNLLCRIKETNIEELGVRTTATGKPIYDSYFIIRPTPDFEVEMSPESVALATTAQLRNALTDIQSEFQERQGISTDAANAARGIIRGTLDKLRARLSELNAQLELELANKANNDLKISLNIRAREEVNEQIEEQCENYRRLTLGAGNCEDYGPVKILKERYTQLSNELLNLNYGLLQTGERIERNIREIRASIADVQRQIDGLTGVRV